MNRAALLHQRVLALAALEASAPGFRERMWERYISQKRKTAPKDGLSEVDNPSARRSRLTER